MHLLIFLTACVLFTTTAYATSIQNCPDGSVTVEKNRTGVLTCVDYPAAGISWGFETPGASIATVGRCNRSSTCTFNSLYSSVFSLTRLSGSSSQLGLKPTISESLTTATFSCGTVECIVHFVAPAVSSIPNITVTTPPPIGSGWTVRGTVDIKGMSPSGTYTCMWSYMKDSEQYTNITSSTITIDPPASATSNRTGQCAFPDRSLPSDPDTYTYRVTVSPGQTLEANPTVVIATPTISSSNCNPNPNTGYVAENRKVTCTCNSNNMGQPAGLLQWFNESTTGPTAIKDGQYGNGTLTLNQTVNRYHDGDKLRCEVDWITDIKGPDFTLQVAWGPDTVSVQGENPFYTYANGSRTLTLTCPYTQVNPSSGLTYQWSSPCEATQQSTCSFNPRPPSAGDNGDDNKEITCTVTNGLNNNKEQQGSFTLDLKYPPHLPPQISGYNNNQILYQGDSLTLTCIVTGGDPVVHSVSLACLGHEQDSSAGQSISLKIQPLRKVHNNVECVCRGRWDRENYYTLTDSRILTVYYPPSSPVVRRIDGQPDPPLEGDTVTLNCTLTSPGYPSARITWLSEEPAVNTNLLQLSVGKKDNQRNFMCQASNEYTDYKSVQLKADFTLEVYYGPDITLRLADGNKCTMTSDRTSCNVTEGERVHLQCEVDSNPVPEDCTWNVPSGSGIDLDSEPDLDIVSANRTHSGVYQVQVQTTKPDINDGRLPRKANKPLAVLVKYEPTETKLKVNDQVNITVNESEALTLVCQSYGRPTPHLQLLQREESISKDGGQLSLSEEMNRLPHTISAMCHNTGTFICRADNGVGNGQQISAEVTVNCKPRSSGGEPEVPKVNFRYHSVNVTFSLKAYPLPDRHRFHYLGNTRDPENSQQPVPENIELSATCTNTYAEYAVECSVIVDNVKDKSAEGFYLYTAVNDFGEASFEFEVTVHASSVQPEEESSVNAEAVALGVTLAVVIVIFLVIDLIFIIWVWRRGWILPCASDGRGQVGQETSSSRHRKEPNRERPPLESARAAVSEDYELIGDGSHRHAGEHQSPSPYASLQTSDIGVPSVYSQISQRSHTVFNVHHDPVYENTRGQEQT